MKCAFRMLLIATLLCCLTSCELHKNPVNSSSVASKAEDPSSKTTTVTQNNSSKEDKDNSSNTNNNSSEVSSHTHNWGIWRIMDSPKGDGTSYAERTCKICRIVETKEATMEDLYAERTRYGLEYSN